MPMKRTPGCVAALALRSGASSLQGTHQEAQKLKTVGRPRNSASERWPSATATASVSGQGGRIGQITGRLKAGAFGRSWAAICATRFLPELAENSDQPSSATSATPSVVGASDNQRQRDRRGLAEGVRGLSTS